MPAKPAATLVLYEGLLRLYPRAYRQQFGDEMIAVFREADADEHEKGTFATAKFCLREIGGLFRGALAEHARRVLGRPVAFPLSSRRFDMRPEFRFPRSTVFLMSIIFAGVILAMEKANTIQVKYAAGADSIWPSLPWFLGLTLLFTCATVVVIWGILFALGRTGVHRLANIQPSTNRTD
ncbi:MAG: hypothetical protein WBQ08_16165 [Candidatus Sulfotelmatobacter sp.]